MSGRVEKLRLGPARVPAAETPGLTGLLTLAVAVVVIAALYLAQSVLIPITLAILLSFVLAPVANFLRGLHLGRVPSVLLSVVLALGIILAIGGLIGIQVADLAGQVPRYQARIEQKIDTARAMTLGRLTSLMRNVGRQIDKANGAPAPADATTPAPAGNSPPPTPVEVHQPTPSPFDLATRVLAPVVSPLSTTAIVVVFAIFVLLQRADLRDRLIRLFGSHDLHRTTAAMDEAAARLSRYFLMQLAINAAFGVVIAAGLLVIGVPSAILWGVLGTLLRFVPYIGAPLSALFPLALAAAVDPGWSMMVWTAALYVCVELVIGQVVEPLVYGSSTGLSPFSVVLAATFWTWLWGPIGLILSTPLTLCLVVLGRHVDRLEFLDVLLGDGPALTPIENFYQRMLAGDPDEAQDQAEALLKDRALSSYYDEVAVPGLRLAAIDVERGVLVGDALARVKEAVTAVIEELNGFPDADPAPGHASGSVAAGPSAAERALPRHAAPKGVSVPRDDLPPAWRGEGAVLCAAGRGPFDGAACAMLAQLLGKHGIGARVAAHDSVSRGHVGALDASGVAMICVIHLDLTGSPSHLRYLVRRLRQRAPAAPVLVGLWSADDTAAVDERMRLAVGADFHAASLREAVQRCLGEAARAATISDPDGVASAA
jgi:predicted PurR-regulated permease PerM